MNALARTALVACFVMPPGVAWTTDEPRSESETKEPATLAQGDGGVSDPSLSEIGVSDERLRSAMEEITKEKNFAPLRNTRRDVLGKISKASANLDALRATIAGLRAEQAGLKKKLAARQDDPTEWEKRLAKVTEEHDKLKVMGPKEGQDNKQYIDELNEAERRLEFVQLRLLDAKEAQQQRSTAKARLEVLDKDLRDLEKDAANKARELEALQEKQFRVEDAINVLLIPEAAKNQFKLYITFTFSALVGFVIIGFFALSFRDEVIRRSVFSSQSGIQFLTLFSVVIAIILFGITDILEGKELAALLGGLSGYILGRVSDR